MLIEENSRYLLKRVRARAKMKEYHVPESLQGEMDKNAKYLLILAIATVGDFSNDIVDNYYGIDCNYEEHKKNLQFSSRFFDAYLNAEMPEKESEYYLLLGSAVYYLCDCNGSSKVLADKIKDDINIDVQGIDFVLTQILKGKEKIKSVSQMEVLNDVVNEYNNYFKTGNKYDFEKLTKLKKYVYYNESDKSLLFSDVLIATIYLKVQYSSYHLMPIYTHVEHVIWRNILKKKTLVQELWQAQRQLGEKGIFSGESATIQMPTSSGKTKAVALIILSSFLQHRTNNAIVVAPFRSLCREITDELQKAFSYTDNIHVNEISDVIQNDFMNILFGNKEGDEEKFIYIVTPEKLLFILRQDILFLSNIGLIIFDEGHLFDDASRGITYELLLATIKFYMRENMQKILISAVIPNVEQVNEWFTDSTGVVIKNNIIQTTEKSVGMADLRRDRKTGDLFSYLYFFNPEDPDEEEFFVPRVIRLTPLRLYGKEKKERIFPEVNDSNHRNDMAIALGIKICVNGGVAIFCGKKDTADNILKRILEIKNRGFDVSDLLNKSDKEEIAKLSYLLKIEMGEKSDYYKAACLGAFVHHGSIPMGIRCSVEYAMQISKINFLACTSTLSQGVNLPIRYLIISNIYQGKERIRNRDFQNLIGRAGRAGIYTEGTVLLSEIRIYNKKNDPYNWRWVNYKKLLSSDSAEACTSALFTWLRADEGMEKYLENIIEIFVKYYANGDFSERIKIYLETQKIEMKENYEKAQYMLQQMIRNIEAIESFLLFYLMEDTYEESKERIHDIIKETLAFHMANDNERTRLFRIIDLVGEFLVYTVDTADKRQRYSKSLLGIKKEIEIEQWSVMHLQEIQNCTSEEEMLGIIFLLLLETDNSIVSKCINKKLLIKIANSWIEGKTYIQICEYCMQEKIMLLKRKKATIMSLQDVINFCDNFLGYDCILVLAAIIENIKYYCDDKNIENLLKQLSKRMKYGLPNQTSVILYEMGFNDRIVSMEMAEILDEKYQAGSRKEIVMLIKRDEVTREKIQENLKKYPSYFYQKWMEIV